MIPAIVATVLALIAVRVHAEVLVQPHDLLAVCTDCRSQPGMASVAIADYFLMCRPVEGVRVYDASKARDSVEEFMKRLDTDLKPLQPNVVLLSHGTGEKVTAEYTRSLTYYHPTYLANSIAGLKKLGVRTIVVGSSGVVDSHYFSNNPSDAAARNNGLAQFRDSDQRTAATTGVLFADIYSPMFATMGKAKALYGVTYHFGSNENWDQYPVANGQLVMAGALLKALGCDGAIGTITVDLAANTAVGSPGHKIMAARGGVVEVESTRYPFCFFGDPAQPESTSGVAALCPFNEDLNRYLLIVKGLSTKQARITWGTVTRELEVSDLARGVNLAAVFAAHTPFDTQFAKVEAAVWAQQQPENAYNEMYFHCVDDLKLMAPTRTAAVDKLGAAILEQDKARSRAAAALVIPVRHTLTIEAIP